MHYLKMLTVLYYFPYVSISLQFDCKKVAKFTERYLLLSKTTYCLGCIHLDAFRFIALISSIRIEN